MKPSRAVAAALAALAFTAPIAGCSWRAETPPLEHRTPSPAVAERDAAALREQAVADAGGEGLPAEIEGATVPVRLSALGGVYLASAGATPSPSGEPLLLADAIVAARDGALTAASTLEDDSLAFLLRSSALSHAIALWSGTAVPGTVAERTVEAADQGDALLPHATSLGLDTLAALALAHDQAAFAYEAIASRESEGARTAALERGAIHRARAAALAGLPGVDDRRESLYDVRAADLADAESRSALARDLEASLAWNYAALLDGASDTDAEWLLNAAFDAYAALVTLPGFTAADIPALPGIPLT